MGALIQSLDPNASGNLQDLGAGCLRSENLKNRFGAEHSSMKDVKGLGIVI